MKAIFFFGISLLFLSACNAVYLEKPMPQSAENLKTIPAGWSGTYEMREPDKNYDTVLYKQCLRLDRLSNTQLLISGEICLAKKDLPALKQQFEIAKSEGRLTEYKITNQFIYSTLNPQREDKSTWAEQQFTALIEQGDLYVLAKSIEPFMMIDLEANTLTKFSKEGGGVQDTELIPLADSLSSETLPLVFRQRGRTYYLNMKAQGQTNWFLYAVSEQDKNNLTIKASFLKDKPGFEERFSYFNKITPFQRIGSDFQINPTDNAMELLLAEPGLFETTYLKKID
jgi:hypothetical protein